MCIEFPRECSGIFFRCSTKREKTNLDSLSLSPSLGSKGEIPELCEKIREILHDKILTSHGVEWNICSKSLCGDSVNCKKFFLGKLR